MSRLTSNREHGLSGLRHTGRNTRHDHVDSDREEGGEDRGEGVLGTTVLGHLNDLADDPADEVHPGHSGGEGETRDNRVERLGLELLGNEVDGFDSLGASGFHCECYTLS